MQTEHALEIPKGIVDIVKTFESKGFQAYLIGGCARDLLLEKKPKDWDITTNATPQEITALFHNTFYENEYGTVGVVNENETDESLKIVEVTPYRTEGAYSDKRRPDKVEWGSKVEDDLKRRDFTINAIALRLENKKAGNKYKVTAVDFFDGQIDIRKKTIRAVGNPLERFNEDALRMLRAVRIAAELNFTIDPATQDSILANARHLKLIASERIRDEFFRVIMSPRPHLGIILSHKLGILKYIAPELEAGIGVEQNKAHSFDVFEHTLRAIEHAARKNFPLETRLAVLFHDIGKPATRRWSEEKRDWTFYGHDVIGTKITAKTLARLAVPKKMIETVTKLVRWHMFFSDTEKITHSAVRRIVTRVGKENIWKLMEVRAADRIGTGRPKESPYRLRKYHAMIDEVLHDPLSVSMLHINGSKIMALSALPPGPKIGYILHALLDEVLDDPTKNTPDYLEKRAAELAHLSDIELKSIGEKGRRTKEMKEEKHITEIRKKHWVE